MKPTNITTVGGKPKSLLDKLVSTNVSLGIALIIFGAVLAIGVAITAATTLRNPDPLRSSASQSGSYGYSSPRVGNLVVSQKPQTSGTVYLVGDYGLISIPDMATFNSWCFRFTETNPANSAEDSLPIVGVLEMRSQGQALPAGVSVLRVSTCPADQMGSLQFYPLAKAVRMLDTRSGAVACISPGKPVGPGEMTVSPRMNCEGIEIPVAAQAIEANITVVNPASAGFASAFPVRQAQQTSSLNFAANKVIGSRATIGLNSQGSFFLHSSVAANYVVDVTGYYAPQTSAGLYFHPLPKPIRMVDTRGLAACRPYNSLEANMPPNMHMWANCEGVTVPASAQAVVGTVTAVNPKNNGFIRIYPSGTPQPNTSNLNFQTGTNASNGFISFLNQGSLAIMSTSDTDVVVDVVGYYSTEPNDVNGAGLGYVPLNYPVRVMDTRPGTTACMSPLRQIVASEIYLQPGYLGCSGMTIPNTAKAINGTVIAVGPKQNGFLRLYPAKTSSKVSSLNFAKDQNTASGFTTALAGDGYYNIEVSATTDVVIDVAGYFR